MGGNFFIFSVLSVPPAKQAVCRAQRLRVCSHAPMHKQSLSTPYAYFRGGKHLSCCMGECFRGVYSLTVGCSEYSIDATAAGWIDSAWSSSPHSPCWTESLCAKRF